MVNKRLSLTAIIFYILLCFPKFTYAGTITEQKNILIINSYSEGITWTQDVTNGAIEVLKKNIKNPMIYIEFMDMKNYPTEENIRHLYNYFEYKYDKKKIDVLIVSDDAALKFALENRESIFSNAPIVFCGVNQEGLSSLVKNQTNITGVIEEIDPTDTIKTALQINPNLKNIYVLFDNSDSGLSTGKLVMDKIHSMNLNPIPLNNLTYDDLMKQIEGLNKDNSILLISTYYTDITGKIVDLEKVSSEVSINSSVPVYHIYDIGLNNGAFGGSMLSGRLQGMNAAYLATRVLSGESPRNISILPLKSTRNVFDYEQLQRFNIPMNKIPKDYELINKPYSFYEDHKKLVLGTISAFTVLTIFLFVLLIHIKKINKMKKDLTESHEELTQIYEELAASEEELKQQFLEVSSVKEELAHLAYYDKLTNVPNKHSLYEDSCFDTFISHNLKAALFFIDVDNFKFTNDTLGHAFGDQLLVMISKRLSSLVQDDSTIYRIGGDEFIIVANSIEDKSEAELQALHIIEGFKEVFNIEDIVLHIGLSIGIAIYPDHGHNLDELLKHADIAMYSAKDSGRNRFVVYNDDMNDIFIERVAIENNLRKALENNEFELYYQPQLDLRSNKITGLEALLRWNSPTLGSVSPLKFIKVAEDTHQIIPLGTWVIKNACAYLKKIHDMGFTDISVSVNISMLQLLKSDFGSIVKDTLNLYQLEPRFLELEITESILMESYETIDTNISTLSKLGVKIALDDFGKGYSSLSYIKQLPINTLKIDKSFIDCICCENKNEILTGQIVILGNKLGMCVVAEGVEKKEQLEYLIKYKCHKIQGYICSKPIPAEAVVELLKTQA